MPRVHISSWVMAKAGEVEVAAAVALVRATMQEKTPSERLSAARTKALLKQWFEVERTGALVARTRERELHGICVLRNEPPTVRILYVGARPARHGVGSLLVERVEQVAARHGIDDLRVIINPEDPVQAAFFCDALGFEVEGDPVETIAGVPHYEAIRPIVSAITAAPPRKSDSGSSDEEQEEADDDQIRVRLPADADSAAEESDAPTIRTGDGDGRDTVGPIRVEASASPTDGDTDRLAAGLAADDPDAKRLSRATARAVVILGATKRRIELKSREVFVVGRDPDADIVIAGRKASRRHCALRWMRGLLHVEDLSSANGTLLNGERVERSPLTEGDVLTVGETHIGFDNLAVRSADVGVAGKLPKDAQRPGVTRIGKKAVSPKTAASGRLTPPSPSARPAVPSAGDAVVSMPVAASGAVELPPRDFTSDTEAMRAVRAESTMVKDELRVERGRRRRVERELQETRTAWAVLSQAVVHALGEQGLAELGEGLGDQIRSLRDRRDRVRGALRELQRTAETLEEALAALDETEKALRRNQALADALRAVAETPAEAG